MNISLTMQIVIYALDNKSLARFCQRDTAELYIASTIILYSLASLNTSFTNDRDYQIPMSAFTGQFLNICFTSKIISRVPIPNDGIAELHWFTKSDIPENELAFDHGKKC
jgi:hypothetical protein